MASSTIHDQIISQLSEMSEDEKRRILEFLRSINGKKMGGISGPEFVRNLPRIPSQDLDEMKHAIEEHCERIDPNGW